MSRAWRLPVLMLALVGCATSAPPGPPATGAPVATAAEWVERARARIARGETAAAAAALRQALREQPDRADARAALGLALHGLGDLDGAVEELRAALRQQPDAVDARLALATALVARQEWAAAREQLERVLAAQPDRVEAHYALGVVRYALGDVAGAIDAYRSVLVLDPRQPDARYNLALVLTLARREAEATPEFVAAAEAGHARAQYFAGTAYAAGLGVERSLVTAIAWWFEAAEQGVAPAADALVQLRQVALGRGGRPSPPPTQQAAEQAFAEYRAALWKRFPDLAPTGDEPVGAVLLRQGRVSEAVTVLIREAWALGEPAQRLLETLYEHGVDGRLPAHDARILAYLRGAAAEGLRPAAP